MSVPKALQYATSSFPISRNTFKLTPYSVQTANPGDQLQVSMPANSVIDLSTISLYGIVTTSTAVGSVGLPTNAESLIDSVYWTANGTQITNSFPMYGVLANAFLDWQGGDKINLRQVLQASTQVVPATTGAATQLCGTTGWGCPARAPPR